MNPEQIRAIFEDLFSAGSGTATAPMLALGVGVLLLVFVGVVERLRKLHAPIFLASIVTALAYEVWLVANADHGATVLDGTLTSDPFTALWGILFLVATVLAWAFGRGYYGRADRPFVAEHDVLLLTTPIGMMLMVGANDLLVFFVGLELLSIPLYALAAFRRSQARSVEAGVKYFLLGAFASGIFLFGTALLYTATGTLSLPALEEGLRAITLSEVNGGAPVQPQLALCLVGIALIGASLFFKASIAPFHLWVPDVYQGSPTPVTALMSTGTKAAAIGFLVKVAFLFPNDAAPVLGALALATMAAGNLGALAQTDLKRMLAYSGIAHAGTLLLVVVATLPRLADSPTVDDATRAALFYMGAYVFTAVGAFGLLAVLERDGEDFTQLDNLRGLARTRPGVAAAMALFMLSLGGIPATGGFIGKWMVFGVLVRGGHVVLAILAVLLSVVALGYYLRVIVTMYMQPADAERVPTTGGTLGARLAIVVCGVGVVALGLFPGLLIAPMS